jgi:hypothetical protein
MSYLLLSLTEMRVQCHTWGIPHTPPGLKRKKIIDSYCYLTPRYRPGDFLADVFKCRLLLVLQIPTHLAIYNLQYGFVEAFQACLKRQSTYLWGGTEELAPSGCH